MKEQDGPKAKRIKRYTFLYDLVENVNLTLSISLPTHALQLELVSPGLELNFDPSSPGLIFSLVDHYANLLNNLLNRNSPSNDAEQGSLVLDKLAFSINFDSLQLNLLSKIENGNRRRSDASEEKEVDLSFSQSQSRIVDSSTVAQSCSSYYVALSVSLRRTVVLFTFHNGGIEKEGHGCRKRIELQLSSAIAIAYANFSDMTRRVLTDEFPAAISFRHFLDVLPEGSDAPELVPVTLLKVSFKEPIGVYFEPSVVHLLHMAVKQVQLSLSPEEAPPGRPCSLACFEVENRTQSAISLRCFGIKGLWTIKPCNSKFIYETVDVQKIELWLTDESAKTFSTLLDISSLEPEILHPIQFQINSSTESVKVFGFIMIQRRGILKKLLIQGSLNVVNNFGSHLAGKIDCGLHCDEYSNSSCSSFEIPPNSQLHLLLPQSDEYSVHLKWDSLIHEVNGLKLNLLKLEKKFFEVSDELVLVNYDCMLKPNSMPLPDITRMRLDAPAILLNQLPFSLNIQEIQGRNSEAFTLSSNETKHLRSHGKEIQLLFQLEFEESNFPLFNGHSTGSPAWTSALSLPLDVALLQGEKKSEADLEKVNESYSVPVSIGQERKFDMNATIFRDGFTGQMTINVHFNYFVVNLTEESVVFRDEGSQDVHEVLAGRWDVFRSGWLLAEKKLISTRIRSSDVDSWSVPFRVDRSINAVLSLRVKKKIYSKFSLTVKKEKLGTIITIRPRYVIVNRTDKTLLVSKGKDPSYVSNEVDDFMELKPNDQIPLNQLHFKSTTELRTTMKFVFPGECADEPIRAFSDEIDFGKPVEIAHLDVPMTNVLNPFQSKMMQYRVVEMNGIYYTILLNEMFPPLTLINSSSTPLLYSVDSVKNGKLLPPDCTVEVFWKKEEIERNRILISKENVILSSPPFQRSIRFGLLGGILWSSRFDSVIHGNHVIPICNSDGDIVQMLTISCEVGGNGTRRIRLLSVDSSSGVSAIQKFAAPRMNWNFSFELTICTLDISLVQYRQEHLHLVINDIFVRLNLNNSAFPVSQLYELSGAISDLQIDNFLEEFEFPVILSFSDKSPRIVEKKMRHALEFIVEIPVEEDRICVKKVEVAIKPIVVNVEEKLVQYLIRFFSDLVDYFSCFEVSPAVKDSNFEECLVFLEGESLDSLCKNEIFVHSLFVSWVHIEATFHLTTAIYLGVSSTPLALGSVMVEKMLCLPHHLLNAFLKHYVLELYNNSVGAIGSLDMLGNPTSVVFSVMQGFTDFLSLPLSHGVRQGRVSASGFLSGLALGSRSLVTHLTHGALKSVMAVSGGAARNIERLSLDPAYYAERDKRSMAPPESLAQGLQRGVSGLASGLWDGFTGLVTAPIEEVKSEGIWGLPTGIGAGLLGAIAKPLGGAFDFVNMTSRGFLSQTGEAMIRPKREKKKLPQNEELIMEKSF